MITSKSDPPAAAGAAAGVNGRGHPRRSVVAGAHRPDGPAFQEDFEGIRALHYRSFIDAPPLAPTNGGSRMARLHLEPAEVAGEPCVRVVGAPIEPVILRTAGPRIIGLERGGQNLFAVCPDAVLRAAGVAPLPLYGGHRLWEAPEVPALTYRPDAGPIDVAVDRMTVVISGPVDPAIGLRREISLRMASDREAIDVDHVVTNHGSQSRRLAPWALTMLPLGGEALLPQARPPHGEEAFQPVRSLVLWPYTRLDDPRLDLADDLIVLRAPAALGTAPDRDAGADLANPFKIGWPNARGWLAYRNRGTVFVKSAREKRGARYADFGASAQSFVNKSWLELETLGPTVTLRPGTSTRHRERWLVADAPAGEPADELARRLALD
jgi:hypothetical protein